MPLRRALVRLQYSFCCRLRHRRPYTSLSSHTLSRHSYLLFTCLPLISLPPSRLEYIPIHLSSSFRLPPHPPLHLPSLNSTLIHHAPPPSASSLPSLHHTSLPLTPLSLHHTISTPLPLTPLSLHPTLPSPHSLHPTPFTTSFHPAPPPLSPLIHIHPDR